MTRYLPIYLNDQLFQQTVAVELCRRALRANREGELGGFLGELATELEADRRELLRRLERAGARPSRGRVVGARLAERLGRLKLNGQLTGYSPLSRLVELDGLATLLEAKRAFWLALGEDEELRALAERARDQRARLEPHRLAAARTALD
ncbi:MAG TPA: hypothetical protein VFL60_00790 [Gaiellaceae bacterium]|nr:hypothetical protein [Gaiellaceae bacterium]